VAVSRDPVAEAIAAARSGALIVLPTDTVYGIGTQPDDRAATARLFEAKGRPRSLELPILVADVRDARAVAVLDGRAERLAEACWPGGLTMVLPRAEESRPWELGGNAETVGVRVPRHPLALAVLAGAGPLAVTSANRTGEPPATTCDEIAAVFGDVVEVVLCQEAALTGQPSTVVDLTVPAGAVVLRPGAVSAETIGRLLPAGSPLLDSPPPS
jgi:L-threonylcarbamoyladenylate synthase